MNGLNFLPRRAPSDEGRILYFELDSNGKVTQTGNCLVEDLLLHADIATEADIDAIFS